MKKDAGKGAGKQRGGEERQEVLPLAELVREALYETVLMSGLAYVSEVLEAEREAVCGPRYRHDEYREAYRSGHSESSLVLGGRRVVVRRPRVRTVSGEEVELPSWRVWSETDPLERRAVEQMVVGVSTRRRSREPEGVTARGTSKSAVSRRFVQGTERKLAELTGRDLSDLELAVLMIDGVHFAEHVVVTAVGVDVEGRKHVLGLWEGATENGASCTALLEDLVERGLDTERAILVVIDGSKALKKAVRSVFGERARIQRCQTHKKRNVLDQLPKSMRESVKAAMNEAYRTRDPERARRLLENLARRLRREHPGAAASLEEGLEETLTVKGFGLEENLERIFSTTNLIENLHGQVRDLTRRVKRWRGGAMDPALDGGRAARSRASLPAREGLRSHARTRRRSQAPRSGDRDPVPRSGRRVTKTPPPSFNSERDLAPRCAEEANEARLPVTAGGTPGLRAGPGGTHRASPVAGTLSASARAMGAAETKGIIARRTVVRASR